MHKTIIISSMKTTHRFSHAVKQRKNVQKSWYTKMLPEQIVDFFCWGGGGCVHYSKLQNKKFDVLSKVFKWWLGSSTLQQKNHVNMAQFHMPDDLKFYYILLNFLSWTRQSAKGISAEKTSYDEVNTILIFVSILTKIGLVVWLPSHSAATTLCEVSLWYQPRA